MEIDAWSMWSFNKTTVYILINAYQEANNGLTTLYLIFVVYQMD